ncbi:MAG: hypothetical protein ACI8RZ_002797 [Myxococcota bacterium]|jgi:hypothetical protein
MIALLTACTFQPGGAFTTLEETTLRGVIEADAVPKDLTLQIDSVVLQSLSVTVRFDQTNPSPPFTLCHNGHCHHEDGSLWSITEIEVWLAGDEATWEDVLVLSGGELDVLSGEALTLDEPVDLPMLSAEQVVLEVGAWWLDGVEQPAMALTGVIELTVDRDLSQRIALDLSVVLSDDDVLSVVADVDAR